jgi:hypothetical protein
MSLVAKGIAPEGTHFAASPPSEPINPSREEAMAKRKTKSMTGSDGGRKLASGAGRAKANRGGEAKKKTKDPRESSKRTGSSKQRKG